MAARSRLPMPADIESALIHFEVRGEYDERPPYQRNDYLRWIEQAKSADTRARRIKQMLDELARSGVYMGMAHASSRKSNP